MQRWVLSGVLLVFTLITASLSHGIDEQSLVAVSPMPPGFLLNRSAEDYSYLSTDPQRYAPRALDVLRNRSLNARSDVRLTVGGQFRARHEEFGNRNWDPDADKRFYSQRVAAHANLQMGRSLRVFTELYHGFVSGDPAFTEYDELDWHQGFIEHRHKFTTGQRIVSRLGRQELSFGAARLVGIREGPNIRRAFDAASLKYEKGKTALHFFYGREVRPNFRVFDNKFGLFDSNSPSPELWGIYSTFHIPGDVGVTEIYYMGFRVDGARFNDVVGDEKRHTIGLRRPGKIGKHWIYNTELMYQSGHIGSGKIRAYNVETDWQYVFPERAWRPSVGLKLELTSGDEEPTDGEINSFNPMFVNPAYYSLAATIAPVNLMSVHPSIEIQPQENLTLYFEVAAFWRQSKRDGIYTPPRFLGRASTDVRDRRIGIQYGLNVRYEFNRNLSIQFELSYFAASDFLEATGGHTGVFHVAPTLSFRF